jgi:protein-S-isoprenylcysteine O-methyltransferase Ste14
VLLISAGKIGWVNAWVCIGLGLSYQLVNTIVLFKLNPQLLNKRGKIIEEGTKFFDKVFIVFYVPLALMISVVAGLDAGRYEWSHMPFNLIIFGVILYILACIFGSWAMAVNFHFEMTVLIKKNGNHQVCTSGPYKVVRHPGYAAAIIGAFSYPLILGSWGGIIAVLPLSLLFVVRTALEDRTLQKELAGYQEYTNITHYRLIPFVW